MYTNTAAKRAHVHALSPGRSSGMGMSCGGRDVPCPCQPSLRLSCQRGDAAGDRSSPSSEKKERWRKSPYCPSHPYKLFLSSRSRSKILSLFQQSQHKVSPGPPQGFPAVQKPLAAIYVLNQDCPTRPLGRRDLFTLETLFFFELASSLQPYLVIL